jgi:hypothetical protein
MTKETYCMTKETYHVLPSIPNVMNERETDRETDREREGGWGRERP